MLRPCLLYEFWTKSLVLLTKSIIYHFTFLSLDTEILIICRILIDKNFGIMFETHCGWKRHHFGLAHTFKEKVCI